MKFSRIALATFFIANSAFAANMAAPLDMKISRIQEGAILQGLPTENLVIPAKTPVQPTYEINLRNGMLIPDGAALDGTFRGGRDPRAMPGYASCTVVLERPTMPSAKEVAQLDESPTSSSATTTFDSGRTVTVQQVVMKFSVMDRFNTVTNNTIYCYRVSDKAMTITDMRAGLGAKFSMLLSADQTDSIQSMAQLRNVVGNADRNLGGGSYKIDEDASAAKPAPGAANDNVSGRETTGGFVTRPTQTPAQ